MQTCKHGHKMTPENTYVHPSHGRRSCRRCRNAGAAERRLRSGRHPRETLTMVPNAPLRERFLVLQREGAVDASTVAASMGWYAGRRPSGTPKPDTGRVNRALGVKAGLDGAVVDGAREAVCREMTSYETAVELAHALGMEPHEAGV